MSKVNAIIRIFFLCNVIMGLCATQAKKVEKLQDLSPVERAVAQRNAQAQAEREKLARQVQQPAMPLAPKTGSELRGPELKQIQVPVSGQTRLLGPVLAGDAPRGETALVGYESKIDISTGATKQTQKQLTQPSASIDLPKEPTVLKDIETQPQKSQRAQVAGEFGEAKVSWPRISDEPEYAERIEYAVEEEVPTTPKKLKPHSLMVEPEDTELRKTEAVGITREDIELRKAEALSTAGIGTETEVTEYRAGQAYSRQPLTEVEATIFKDDTNRNIGIGAGIAAGVAGLAGLGYGLYDLFDEDGNPISEDEILANPDEYELLPVEEADTGVVEGEHVFEGVD